MGGDELVAGVRTRLTAGGAPAAGPSVRRLAESLDRAGNHATARAHLANGTGEAGRG